MSRVRWSIAWCGLLFLGACLDHPASDDSGATAEQESTLWTRAHVSRGDGGFLVSGLVGGAPSSMLASAVTLDGRGLALTSLASPNDDGLCVICTCSASTGRCVCNAHKDCPE